jgi:hypothetical protein
MPDQNQNAEGGRLHDTTNRPTGNDGHGEGSRQSMQMGWGRLASMIGTSTLVMFFLMYQLVYEADHLRFSLNRGIAALVMGAVMTVVMLGFMWSMYEPKRTKVTVIIAAGVAGVVLLSVNRAQRLISDVTFMKAMIPHHSIAINNATKADIRDPRVRELADEIVSSQLREIDEMKRLIDDIEHNGRRGEDTLPARRAAVTPDTEPRISDGVR